MRRIRPEVVRVVGEDRIWHNIGTKCLSRHPVCIILNKTRYGPHVPGDDTDNTIGQVMLRVGRIVVAEFRTID